MAHGNEPGGLKMVMEVLANLRCLKTSLEEASYADDVAGARAEGMA
jgi:hypothetical protein